MNTIKFLLATILAFGLILNSACKKQETAWEGTIETKDGVTIVKNPKHPMHSESVLELREDLVIKGSEEAEEQMFQNINTLDVDEEGNMEKAILDWLEIEGDEWESQYPQIVDKLSNYWIDTLVVDSTGVGDPVRERLSFMLPDVNVAPFIFSPSTKDIGYKYLLKEVNAGRIVIPYHSEARKTKRFRKFEHQMVTLRKHYSGKFLNPKPVDDDKGHDDYPDSLMLAVYATYFDVMPEIDVDDAFFFKNNRVDYDVFGHRYSRPRR